MSDSKISYGGALLVVLAMMGGMRAQESAPAQPLAEAQIAQEFKAAAPDLFKDWQSRWTDALKQQETKGRRMHRRDSGRNLSGHPELDDQVVPGWIVFSECVQDEEPSAYTLDVKRTDSILTPFIGTLTVTVTLKCEVRKVITPGAFVTKEKTARIEAACIDHTYEECLASGAARPVPTGGLYAGLGDLSFTYKGEVVLAYRWSEGKWEFKEEKAEPPLPLQRPEQAPARASVMQVGIVDGGRA